MKRSQGGLKGIHTQHNLQQANEPPMHTWESRFFGIYKWQNIDFEQKNLVKLACDSQTEALTAWQSLDGAVVATQYHPEVTPESAAQIFAAAPNLPKANPLLLAPTYQAFTSFLCGAKLAAI